MAKIYDNTDFTWSSRGDYVLGHDGDFSDTYYDPLRSVVQEIRTRLQSDKRDWKLSPEIGASLSDFVGEPNNKITAEAIKARIIAALAQAGLIRTEDITVRYMPIDIDKILFRIKLDVMSTARNAGSESLTIDTIYSYSENNIYYIR